ncbi:MAG: hypothetical protein Q7V17_13020 [Afipia sp.]|nr:hypothetical protein [Afipia sp.]
MISRAFIHWRRLIAINAAIILGYAIYKIVHDIPDMEYVHLLVGYHFGFTKRALIGALVSLGADRVPPWLVYVLGGTALLATAGLYLHLFKRTFGFSQTTAPLLVFIAGSPFFLKNFVKTIGYFDIYGCLLAIAILLVPARSFAFVALAACGSIALILIHHIHMLLYVPTIASIVVIRYYLNGHMSKPDLALGAAMAGIVSAVFATVQIHGNVPVSQAAFSQYLSSRMGSGGAATDALSFAYIWFRTLPDEVNETWRTMPENLSTAWAYPILIALHAPLIRYFRDSIRVLSSPLHRRVVLAALVAISLGYLVICVTVFDYARWVSSWAVCMMLMLHAVKQLPASGPVTPIALDDKRALGCAIVLTAIPRVGIIRPF